jgi:hypothetical protein
MSYLSEKELRVELLNAIDNIDFLDGSPCGKEV